MEHDYLTRQQHDFCCYLAEGKLQPAELITAMGWGSKGSLRNMVSIMTQIFEVPPTGSFYHTMEALRRELRARGYDTQATSMTFEGRNRFPINPRRSAARHLVNWPGE